MAITFMEENTDSLALERLYLKSVLPARDALVEIYLRKKVFFQELLNYEIVADFLQKNFNGKYKSDNNFMIASSTLKLSRVSTQLQLLKLIRVKKLK